ncbi:hypothetical protein [Singulisphaera sp. PoT]|uniref:hypothetical protein n=1 Tax=Singulisphaera sp. PoT TaxID=3411797 RepID=UPI003BF4B0EE
MAGLIGSFKVGPVAITGGTPQTLLQIVAPANQRLKVIGYEISFDGTNSANTPCAVQIVRQTTAGTATNTAVAPTKINEPGGVSETLQASSQNTYTVEPTAGDLLESYTVPVFGGLYAYSFPPGQEIMIPGGTRLGFKVSCPQGVNAYLTAKYEE